MTAQGRIARLVRTRFVPLILPLIFRLPGIRPLLFRTVSQTGIHYRNSPLSTGAAGSVRGGDRLPWIYIGQNQDNFAPLTSMAWQVHVYGDARAGLADACALLGFPIHTFTWTPAMERAGLEPRGTVSHSARRIRRTGRP